MSGENDYLINTTRYKRECCFTGLTYIIYFLYHICLFGLVSVNTYYTINMADDINNDTDTITNELNNILYTINKYLNSTI